MHLNGRLILDCSALLPGPLMGKLLALRGARVVKVENPKRPDGAKQMMKAVYSDLNSLKEVVSLDLTDPNDIAVFHKWVRKADGLIEGFRPQAKLKLGLDEKTLHGINPKLSILSLVGYPEDGPWRDRAGHDLNFSALSGCASLFEEMPALPLGDLFSAYEGAFALTAAMDSVTRGGAGSRVVVTILETLKQVQSTLVSEYQSNGNVPKAHETLFSGKYPCYRIYTAADGRRISMGAIEHKFWMKVCEILNVPELMSQGYAQGDRGSEVISMIQNVFQTQPWSHWANLFDGADCCVEPILDYSEVFSHGV